MQQHLESTVLTGPAVPASLSIAAAWCWRILLVAGTFLALVLVFSRLRLMILPVFFALLLSALLHPLVAWLRLLHLPRAVATWGAVLIAFLVAFGIGWFVEQQASSNYQQIVNQVDSLLVQLRGYIARLPGANSDQLQQLQQQAVTALKQHSGTIATGVLAAGAVIGELITGLIVTFFVTFFFLEEGDRMWSWTVRLFPKGVQPSIRGAGYRVWEVLSGWVVGTASIAAFHGVVIGVAMVLLGVPLAVPLAVLVFVGSFIPLVGALVFGGLAVLVTLITQGLVPGIILLAVLVVENQVEAHLLQPFVVGRAVKLHPVSIVLSLTGGGVIGGIFGAILAIPIVASVHAAVKYLTGIEDIHGNSHLDSDRMAPEPPPDYAPLPLYASPLVLPDDHRQGGGGAVAHLEIPGPGTDTGAHVAEGEQPATPGPPAGHGPDDS